MGASPGAAVALTRMNAEIDIRGVLRRTPLRLADEYGLQFDFNSVEALCQQFGLRY